jgi:hypothetical protein
MLKARERKPEVIQPMLERLARDRDVERARVGEVRQAHQAGRVCRRAAACRRRLARSRARPACSRARIFPSNLPAALSDNPRVDRNRHERVVVGRRHVLLRCGQRTAIDYSHRAFRQCFGDRRRRHIGRTVAHERAQRVDFALHERAQSRQANVSGQAVVASANGLDVLDGEKRIELLKAIGDLPVIEQRQCGPDGIGALRRLVRRRRTRVPAALM